MPSEAADLRALRLASLAEGATFLILLLVAMPLRHVLGQRWATQMAGPVHGAAFLAYGWLVLYLAAANRWRARDAAALILAASLPFGGLLNAWLLRRREAALPTAGHAA